MTSRAFLQAVRRALYCGGAGVLLAGVTQATLQAQDRTSDSFGQPYERIDQDRRSDQSNRQQERRSYRQQSGDDQQQYDQYRDDRPSAQRGQEDDRRQSGQQGNRGGLGIVARESDSGRGVQVADVYRDSPALEAGIRRGDLIVEVDGRQVSSVANLQSIIGQRDPREQVELLLVRDGRERVVTTQLESRRDALSDNLRSTQGRQGRQDYQDSRQRDMQGRSQQRLETRLASLEQRLERMLNEIRQLRQEVNGQGRGRDFDDREQQFGRTDWEQDQRSSYQRQQQRRQTGEESQFDRQRNQRDQGNY